MNLLKKKNIQRDLGYFFYKKWLVSLLLVLGLFSCKSTDCGCPMAWENQPEIKEPIENEMDKKLYWKKTLKPS